MRYDAMGWAGRRVLVVMGVGGISRSRLRLCDQPTHGAAALSRGGRENIIVMGSGGGGGWSGQT